MGDMAEMLLSMLGEEKSAPLNYTLDQAEMKLRDQLKQAQAQLKTKNKNKRANKQKNVDDFNKESLRIANDLLCHSVRGYLNAKLKNRVDLFNGIIKMIITMGDAFDFNNVDSFLKGFFAAFKKRIENNRQHYYSFRQLLNIQSENNLSDAWLNEQIEIHQSVHKTLNLSAEYKVVEIDGEIFYSPPGVVVVLVVEDNFFVLSGVPATLNSTEKDMKNCKRIHNGLITLNNSNKKQVTRTIAKLWKFVSSVFLHKRLKDLVEMANLVDGKMADLVDGNDGEAGYDTDDVDDHIDIVRNDLHLSMTKACETSAEDFNSLFDLILHHANGKSVKGAGGEGKGASSSNGLQLRSSSKQYADDDSDDLLLSDDDADVQQSDG